MKGSFSINGNLKYIGDHPPKVVEYDFTLYQAAEESMQVKGSSELKGIHKAINHFGGEHQQVDLEVFKKAINNAYIELKWTEQEKNKVERVQLNIA